MYVLRAMLNHRARDAKQIASIRAVVVVRSFVPMHFATLRILTVTEHTGHNLGTVPKNYTNAELASRLNPRSLLTLGRYNGSTNGCRRASEAVRIGLVAGGVRGVRYGGGPAED